MGGKGRCRLLVAMANPAFAFPKFEVVLHPYFQFILLQSA
jgi:hypothetical protein